MGGSSWSDDLYKDRAAYRRSVGAATFIHDDDIKRGRVEVKVHDKLNPLNVKVREARDSDAHPESVAIGVVFDVTGSMHSVPRGLQQKLTKLMGLLLDKKYCKDPQILVGAIGDYYSDRVPLQVAQFESGIEIDDQLGLLYLEAGGGGSYEESYQNALYFFARHTTIDCWEKRGKKGYLFIIGDEKPYGASSSEEIQKIFGDSVEGDVKITDMIREIKERYNLFFIIPSGTSHYEDPALRDCWAKLIGAENVIMLDNPDLVCEAIGSTIGMFESALTLDRVVADLGGAKNKDALVVKSALDRLATSAAVKSASGGVPEGTKESATNVRL